MTLFEVIIEGCGIGMIPVEHPDSYLEAMRGLVQLIPDLMDAPTVNFKQQRDGGPVRYICQRPERPDIELVEVADAASL